MKIIKLQAIALILIITSLQSIAQTEPDIETKVVKNAITVRPFNFILGMYGISYERYIAKGFSVLVYGDYIKGPDVLINGVYANVRNSMHVKNAKIKYTGFSMVPEVRYYFPKDEEQYSLVGNKDMRSLTGWFVGGYVPIHKLKMDFDINSVENQYNALQTDRGSYSFDSYLIGFGVEGGGHWVWGGFSLELVAGLAFMKGTNSPGNFKFTREGVGEYYKEKDLGIIKTYSNFAPRFGLNLGFAF